METTLVRATASERSVPLDLQCHVLPRVEGEDGSTGQLVLLSFTPNRRAWLTEAERHVALAITRGLTNAAIGAERGVSPRTVANQVAALLRKCGVCSRVELAGKLGPLDFT
jgi:DNA-binding NarL/FixJ family response regulator